MGHVPVVEIQRSLQVEPANSALQWARKRLFQHKRSQSGTTTRQAFSFLMFTVCDFVGAVRMEYVLTSEAKYFFP